MGAGGKPGTNWGILLKLINCQPTQTADHPFRYREKDEHKQLNKHLNLYPPTTTISAFYVFSTSYTQSSKFHRGGDRERGDCGDICVTVFCCSGQNIFLPPCAPASHAVLTAPWFPDAPFLVSLSRRASPTAAVPGGVRTPVV